MDKGITNLFWTGGWDSTFRLLQLIFEEHKYVKPHYIVTAQECTGKEIDTINKIKRRISRNHPEKSKFLLPISYMGIGEIKENKAIEREYQEIKKTSKINKQYKHLACYCHQIDVHSIELSVLSSESFEYLESNSTIFNSFDLPVLGYSKMEMAQIAERKGWKQLMKMTWFCRRPNKGRPCGFCGPCTDAVLGGVGWRLPMRARIIAYLQLPFRKWWRNNYQIQDKGILKKISTYLIKKNKV